MSLINRTITTLFSRIDDIVGEIENHDALIQATIVEQKKKMSAARVELSRIRNQEDNIKQRLFDMDQKRAQWERRAVKESQTDEDRALACLMKRQAIMEREDRLRKTESEYRRASEKMQADIDKGDNELNDLIQKHQIMRARQSTADALNKVKPIAGTGMDELATCFDRWEVKISHSEYSNDAYDIDLEDDDLERSFIEEEMQIKLRAELAELLSEGEQA